MNDVPARLSRLVRSHPRFGPALVIQNESAVSGDDASMMMGLGFNLEFRPESTIDLSKYVDALALARSVALYGVKGDYANVDVLQQCVSAQHFLCTFALTKGLDFSSLRAVTEANVKGAGALSFLSCPSIVSLDIEAGNPSTVIPVSPSLTNLCLLGMRKAWSTDSLSDVSNLEKLEFVSTSTLNIASLASAYALRSLKVTSCHSLEGLQSLVGLFDLEYVELQKVKTLEPAGLLGLRDLELRVIDCPSISATDEGRISDSLNGSSGNVFFFPQKRTHAGAGVGQAPGMPAKRFEPVQVLGRFQVMFARETRDVLANVSLEAKLGDAVSSTLWSGAPVSMRGGYVEVAGTNEDPKVICRDLVVARDVCRVLNLAWATPRRLRRLTANV